MSMIIYRENNAKAILSESAPHYVRISIYTPSYVDGSGFLEHK